MTDTVWHKPSLLKKFLNFFWDEACACIWKYLPGQSILWKDNLASFYYLFCAEPLHLFYDREFAVVTYSAKIMLIINCKDVSFDRFPQPSWYLTWHYFVFGSYCLKIKTYGGSLPAFDYLFCVSIHVNPLHCLTCLHSCFYFYAHMFNVWF